MTHLVERSSARGQPAMPVIVREYGVTPDIPGLWRWGIGTVHLGLDYRGNIKPPINAP